MKLLIAIPLLTCTATLCLAASIPEQLSLDGYTKMSSLLNGSNLNDTLKGRGPFTLFVPNNEAFENVTLPTDKTQLQQVLENHVIPGNITLKNLTGEWTTLARERLNISKSENDTFIINNKAHIAKNDIFTDNGVIHQIDSVLLPTNTSITSGNASNATSSSSEKENAT